ncbi:MAG: homocysteine S-methyltransferase family protein [Candidatus Kapabacteria bacterium]|nr:homocysteine S-methyltransferase family protein [Candidatus Kapabacteria bacterium]
MTNNPFLSALNSRVLLFDGATGTNLQQQNLTADDFGGKHLEGCNEYLCISKPDAVRKVHYDFLRAGADIIETNSFGSTSVVLAEYDIAEMSYELSFLSAKIARECADELATPDKPRFVAGSMGPGTKLLSLGHIDFDIAEEAFYLQAKGLIDGGADVLCIETCQDILQVKSAINGAERAVNEWRASTQPDWRVHQIPFIVSVTIETTGTMLMGTEIASALTTLEPYQSVNVIGMNCATGPKEMEENIRYLCQNSPKTVFIMPNAGLPENIGGVAHYHLTPEEMLTWMKRYVGEFGVGMIGGCCGTTHEHIQLLADWLKEYNADTNHKPREYEFVPSVSSVYTSVTMRMEPAPLLVGERCNANGSKKFRELLLAEDYDSMVNMAKEQIREGAHVLDVCVAYVGRDEVRDMIEVMKRFNTQVTIPLMIDSTEVNVIEAALKHYAGRAIINSINFEDGTEKADKILHLAKQYGASVVALSIDEEGQAYSFEKKVSIAKRIRDHVVDVHGMREEDLIFDALTFPLGSGQEDLRSSGMDTINAIREIKRIMPRSKTILGLSNCSFGLSPHTRHVLNSVFLHYAIEAGLDMAIVHASKIMPLYKIDERGRELCRELIFDERKWEEVVG